MFMARDPNALIGGRKPEAEREVPFAEVRAHLPADTPVAEAAHSVMREWAPAHAALLDAVAAHLPSPREAQVRRVGALFDLLPSADGDAEAAEPRAAHGAVEAAVAACDADGPAVVFVAKMLPADAASARGGAQGARFVAVARVLSGRVRAGTPLVAVGGAAAGTRAVVARVVALRGGCADATVADGAVAGDVAGLIGVESPALRGAKLREEADELARAETRDEVVWEAADVLYFTLARLAAEGIELAEVEAHLDRRALKVTRRG